MNVRTFMNQIAELQERCEKLEQCVAELQRQMLTPYVAEDKQVNSGRRSRP
jgi:hypothetical protein